MVPRRVLSFRVFETRLGVRLEDAVFLRYICQGEPGGVFETRFFPKTRPRRGQISRRAVVGVQDADSFRQVDAQVELEFFKTSTKQIDYNPRNLA